jgi:hypothetical protein
MEVNSVDKDDFMFALGQTLKFYGKQLEKESWPFWYQAFFDEDIGQVKQALMRYTREGKYAPKPKDILEIVDVGKSYRKAALPPPKPMTTNCPPEIAKAWMWFINRVAQGGAMAGLFQDSAPVDLPTQERYLHIVNHEAQRLCTPDAIPDEFKLQEVWAH